MEQNGERSIHFQGKRLVISQSVEELVDVDICGCYAAAAAIQRAEEGATGRETQRQRGVPPERRGGAHAGQDGAREKWCWCGGSKEGVGHKEGGVKFGFTS